MSDTKVEERPFSFVPGRLYLRIMSNGHNVLHYETLNYPWRMFEIAVTGLRNVKAFQRSTGYSLESAKTNPSRSRAGFVIEHQFASDQDLLDVMNSFIFDRLRLEQWVEDVCESCDDLHVDEKARLHRILLLKNEN